MQSGALKIFVSPLLTLSSDILLHGIVIFPKFFVSPAPFPNM